MKGYNGGDDYLKSRFKDKGARNLRRQQKKLQREISPVKVVHYGETESKALDLIFDYLKLFLENRFEQKEVVNYELPFLPLYKKMFRELLPDKKAVIFSLFDKQRPIAMGIGFVVGEVLYLFNIAYDMNYSEYGPGNQIMMNALNWCFDNGISLLDMGRGDFMHKRQWVNTSYTYRQLDLYDFKNPIGTFRSVLSWTKNNCRFYGLIFLKKMKVHKKRSQTQKK